MINFFIFIQFKVIIMMSEKAHQKAHQPKYFLKKKANFIILTKLQWFLNIFNSLTSYKSLNRLQYLNQFLDIIIYLLIITNEKIQLSCVEILSKYYTFLTVINQSDHQSNTYKTHLINLCSSKSMRNEMINFPLHLYVKNSKHFILSQIIIRILYAKLFIRNNKKKNNDLKLKRNVIFSYLNTLDSSYEIIHLYNIIFSSYHYLFDVHFHTTPHKLGLWNQSYILTILNKYKTSHISLTHQLALLNIFTYLIKFLPKSTELYLPMMLTIMFHIYQNSQLVDIIENKAVVKSIDSLCFQLMYDIIQRYPKLCHNIGIKDQTDHQQVTLLAKLSSLSHDIPPFNQSNQKYICPMVINPNLYQTQISNKHTSNSCIYHLIKIWFLKLAKERLLKTAQEALQHVNKRLNLILQLVNSQELVESFLYDPEFQFIFIIFNQYAANKFTDDQIILKICQFYQTLIQYDQQQQQQGTSKSSTSTSTEKQQAPPQATLLHKLISREIPNFLKAFQHSYPSYYIFSNYIHQFISYINTKDIAMIYVEILYSFLYENHVNEFILSALIHVIPLAKLATTSLKKMKYFLNKFFLKEFSVKIRLLLSTLYDLMTKEQDEQDVYSSYIINLNSIKGINQLINYDLVTNTYIQIQNHIKNINDDDLSIDQQKQMLVIIYQCIYHILHPESGIRLNASYVLELIMIKFYMKNVYLMDEIIYPLLRDYLNRYETITLNSRNLIIKLISILVQQEKKCGVMVKDTSTTKKPKKYHCLLTLCNENLDLDFWHNITHIQKHRIRKAIQRLQVDQIDSIMLYELIIPILMFYIHHYQSLQYSGEHQTLMEEIIKKMASISLQLQWTQYYQFLYRFSKRYIYSADKFSKLTVRVYCLCIESFHFDIEQDEEQEPVIKLELKHQENEQVAKAPATAAQVTTTTTEVEADEDEKKKKKKKKIRQMLLETFIPSLHKLLKSTGIKKKSEDDEDELNLIRIPVALSLVKLLKKLPIQVLHQQINSLLSILSHYLRSRIQKTRDVTRQTLELLIKELGANYLHFFIKELSSHLTRGYQRHVLLNTFHSLLSSVTIYIDDVIDILMPFLINDLIGELAQEKVIEIKSILKEARVNKADQSIELLCLKIHFQHYQLVINHLLQYLLDHTASLSQLNIIKTVIIQRIAKKVLYNPSLYSDPKSKATGTIGTTGIGTSPEDGATKYTTASYTY